CPYSEYQDWYKLGSLCVKYYSTPLKFTDAEIFCRREVPGGHLVSVQSNDSNSNISELQQQNNNGSTPHIWLGAYKIFQTNEFLWTDGSTWDFKNWVPGQPDNTRDTEDTEDCVEMNWKKEGGWNDHHCSEKKSYMCVFKQSA
uniref:C-type lectin domain-containing protein n=1 Tax=Lepisosteus oculatus TaxID=7918 RepID=W5MJG5_LEPOC